LQLYLISKQLEKLLEEQYLGNFAIMPADFDTSFNKWWKSLEQSAAADIRYPYGKYWNALKPLHSAKTSTIENLLKFVDMNSLMKDQLI